MNVNIILHTVSCDAQLPVIKNNFQSATAILQLFFNVQIKQSKHKRFNLTAQSIIVDFWDVPSRSKSQLQATNAEIITVSYCKRF